MYGEWVLENKSMSTGWENKRPDEEYDLEAEMAGLG